MIQAIISKAIKEHKWLAIEYENTNELITNYWIAITGISIKRKSFFVDAFNLAKIANENSGLIKAFINFDKIKNAYIIENTTYNQPETLIQKITLNLDNLGWLGFDSYNNNILCYINECMKYEEVAYQKETTLIRGVDQDELEKIGTHNKYILTLEQIIDLVPKLEKLSKQDQEKKYETIVLALNLLAISTKKGLFIVAYKELNFNPIEKSLILSNEIFFNYDFTSGELNNYKHNLKNYLDIETDEFIELFIASQEKAKNKLALEIKRFNETLDDRPYIFELRRSYYYHIENEIQQIKQAKMNNQLSIPLVAFFGNMTKNKLKDNKHVDVVIFDDKVNIDQLRVIYNALVQPITYVQGPPGTGKTSTIINVLISAFFNNQKVLLCSNNNKPITDIYHKLLTLKSKNKRIPLPFLRLGNNEEVLKSLDYLKNLIPEYQKLKNDDSLLDIHASNKKEKMKEINRMLELYESHLDLEEEIDALNSMKTEFKIGDRQTFFIDDLLYKKNELLSKSIISESDIKPFLKTIDTDFLTWLFFTSIKYLKRLLEPKNKKILSIINSTDNETRIKEFNSYLADEENFKNLQRIFPIILTTNQSAYKLGPQEQSFDLVIIDEAAQCLIGHSLFAISRGKRLLLVGDQKQLKPISSISPETNRILLKKYNISSSYDYLQNSILVTMQKKDTISKFVLLSYHYRSRKQIINFSNAKYYHNQLKIPLKDLIETPALEFIDVDTSNISINTDKNVSLLEINELIKHLKSSNEKSIGVITPFRNQANMITNALKDIGLDKVEVGTIHTFQGDEKDVIYFSSGLTKNTYEKTFDWVKNNQELINVAATRAKNRFILLTDYKEIEKRSKVSNDFYELTQYVKKNGKEVILTESDQTSYINGANFKNFNTKKEAEFFETINHIMSLNTNCQIKEKVRLSTVFDIKKLTDTSLREYALKAEFDMVIYSNNIPKLAFEFDGDEHQSNLNVVSRDIKKDQICRECKLQIIRIPNDYSRRYVHIKEILKELI